MSWSRAVAGVLVVACAGSARAADELDVLFSEPPSRDAAATGNEDDAPTEGGETGREPRAGSESPTLPSSGSGAPQRARPVIEEIIVTAQKRSENIRDVPMSVSSISGETLEAANVANLNDVSLFTPNVKFQVTPNSTFVNIRGLGTGENRGFEQSVGLVIDGVYYGRGEYMVGGLLDLDRIEILRGPQGTLFGKNTIAGALNITTGIPEDDLRTEAAVLYGRFDQIRYGGMVTGPAPFTDRLSWRFAFENEDRDGYIFNNHPKQHQANVDNTLWRAKARWLPFDDLELILGYDRNDVAQVGDGYQLHEAGDASLAFYRQYDPETEADPTNFFTSTDDERSGGERVTHSGTLNANWDVGEFRVTGITGLSELSILQVADADFSSAPFIGLLNRDDYRQISQEIRLLSPPGPLEYVAGLYYFQSRFVVRTSFDVAKDGDAALLAGATGLPPGLTGPGADLLNAALMGGGAVRDKSRKHFDQDTRAYAAFGQATWRPFDRWALVGGLRLGRETKDVVMSNRFENTGLAFQAILGEEEFELREDRSETDFSPKVSTLYDLTEDVNAYATWARGFKSGGFNQFAPTASDVQFGPENATTIEAGSKMRLLDGAMNLNVGYFHTNFDDLQVTIFNGTQFVVGNAARAVTQGVELDGMWLPLENLALTFSGGFTDAEYEEYRDGPCWADGDGSAGPNPREREEDGACFQDLSGETLHRAPDLNAAFGFDLGLPVWTWPFRFVTGAHVFYQDDYFLNLDLDPVDFQKAYTQVDARFGFQSESEIWSVMFFGRNLTDEVVFMEAADVPLFEGDHFSRQDLPRTFAAELRVRF